MSRTLNPYDTGEVLEPIPWIPMHRRHDGDYAPDGDLAIDLDDYGKVDFDDEESGTRAVIHVVRNDEYRPDNPGADGSPTEPYTIRIAGEQADFAIEWIANYPDEFWDSYAGPMLDQIEADARSGDLYAGQPDPEGEE